MADLKISALTGATTPLAGTEVLPIVQSGSTVKVSVANLTAGRAVAASSFTASGDFQTTGDQFVFSSSGGGVSAGHLLKGSTGEVQTWCGGAVAVTTTGSATTLNNSNLVIGTSGKGIDFSVTPGTGTSELLADYEEGDWTPTIIGSTTAGTGSYAAQTGIYTKIGRQVTIRCYVDWSAHTGTGALRISGLPFTIANDSVFAPFPTEYDNLTVPANALVMVVTRPNQTFLQADSFTTGAASQSGLLMDAAASLWFSATYFV